MPRTPSIRSLIFLLSLSSVTLAYSGIQPGSHRRIPLATRYSNSPRFPSIFQLPSAVSNNRVCSSEQDRGRLVTANIRSKRSVQGERQHGLHIQSGGEHCPHEGHLHQKRGKSTRAVPSCFSYRRHIVPPLHCIYIYPCSPIDDEISFPGSICCCSRSYKSTAVHTAKLASNVVPETLKRRFFLTCSSLPATFPSSAFLGSRRRSSPVHPSLS